MKRILLSITCFAGAVGAAGMQSRVASATERITSVAPESAASSSKTKHDEEKGSPEQAVIATTTFNTSGYTNDMGQQSTRASGEQNEQTQGEVPQERRQAHVRSRAPIQASSENGSSRGQQ